MRDEHDTMTAEIPGEVAPPPKRPKELVRREEAGYMGPRQAPTCRHCAHSAKSCTTLRCDLHGFIVELGGVCGSFAAAGPK